MEEEEKKEVREIDPLTDMKIPQCCVEGWDSCPHVVKKEKKKKQNIGL